MVGQQHTVLIDGNIINQFDNGVPRLASRNGDPPTQARQFAEGYFGLQTHGGTDRIFYREIRVKDLGSGDIPRNVDQPELGGSGQRRQGADVRSRRVGQHAQHGVRRRVVPQQPDRARPRARPRARAGGPGQLQRSGRGRVRRAGAAVSRPAEGRRRQEVHADRGGRGQERLLPGVRDQGRRGDGLEDLADAADRRELRSPCEPAPATGPARRDPPALSLNLSERVGGVGR